MLNFIVNVKAKSSRKFHYTFEQHTFDATDFGLGLPVHTISSIASAASFFRYFSDVLTFHAKQIIAILIFLIKLLPSTRVQLR